MITRRESLFLLAAPALAKSRPPVAITMDDVRWQSIPERWRAEAEERLLASMGKTQAFLFAIGELVSNEQGTSITESCSWGGHWIGNHTYVHVPLLGRALPEDFEAGILRAEGVLRKCSGFRKWFRFPLLKEGQTRDIRDRLRSFLTEHGYRNGAVTIDASDWYYNQRLLDRIKQDPAFDPMRFRQPYLNHIWDRAQYYDNLSLASLGRTVPHTLLVHYNFLNSLFLADVLAMFRAKGWEHIGAGEAFADPVFARLPDTVPAGESLIWALAKETGKFEGRLRYPGEDDIYEKPLLDRMGL